ncbi:MAG: type III-B CRISPR module RAMP protein Cmr1 [Rhodothermia bacterium]|nr:type III-B CRISPR module RAMP protein Cmr1 [Rhodothermia bacterium]
MFLNGADGETPELRPSSLKGAMRFWWRALNGHLQFTDRTETRNDKTTVLNTGLKTRETLIFGGAGGGKAAQRSSFSIQMRPKEMSVEQEAFVPHKQNMKAKAFKVDSTFEVIFRFPKEYRVCVVENGKEIEIFNQEKLDALFRLTCILGGLGKRVRRGMGSIGIETISLENIYNYISILSPHYSIKNNSIINTFRGGTPSYGLIEKIEIGNSTELKSYLERISYATHTIKLKYKEAYEVSMGHASKGRYASPVFASIGKGSYIPVITTLKLAPERNKDIASLRIQDEFKDLVIK